MAAGMSFFGVLSLVPLALIGVSVLGYVLGSSDAAQKFVYNLIFEYFPNIAMDILNQIHEVIKSPDRGLITGLSFIGLVWSGIRFFYILQNVLNNVWVGARQRWFLIARATAFLIFIAAGALFWASFLFRSLLTTIRKVNIAGISLENISWLWWIVELLTPLIASIIMVFLVYMFVPYARVSFRAAFIGSCFTAVVTEIVKMAFSYIIVNFSNYGVIYGPLAGLIIFMTWVYISMQVLLLGAELGSQCQSMFFPSQEEEV